MTWDEFYDRYVVWSESTIRSRISSLEDIGEGVEVVSVATDISDERIRAQLIRKAIRLGAVFTEEDISLLEGEVPEEVLEEACGKKRYESLFLADDIKKFNRMTGEELDCLTAEINAAERGVDMETEGINRRKRHKKALFSAACIGSFVGIVKGLFTGSKKHGGKCDGNCDSCPAHYGYRYGRWYYGHGHQRGCEFHGNGGKWGKTYRN